ncbi:type 4a pilus biogenesis protein PilO [candidate division WOR-3 bacterium]|nr:type 4a pilus biogenesis protein PilO [candidate division WOR-3 bacterium]MCK4526713.1 type 4a pilus biogenesis protein PilO [candidate division WOR-3 bacterium]
MRKLRPSIFIGILAILIFVGGYYTTIKKTKEKIKTKEEEYQLVESKLRKTRAVVKRKEEANRRLQIVSKRWKQAKRMLPTEADIPILLGTIEKLSGTCEVDIQRFKPLPQSAKEKYIEVPIEITINGGYHDIAHFMAAMNNMERIVNIKNLKLKGERIKEGVEKEEFKIKASFILVTYISKGGKDEG